MLARDTYGTKAKKVLCNGNDACVNSTYTLHPTVTPDASQQVNEARMALTNVASKVGSISSMLLRSLSWNSTMIPERRIRRLMSNVLNLM